MPTPLGNLVEQAAAGDSSALESLLNQYRKLIANRCRQLLGSGSAFVDDAVQMTLIEVSSSLSGFTGEADFATWVYKIATRVVAKHYAENTRRAERLEQHLAFCPAGKREMMTFTLQNPLPNEQDIVNRIAINQILKHSQDHIREWIELQLQGYSYAEISQVSGVPESTIILQVKEACKRMSRLLKAAPATGESS